MRIPAAERSVSYRSKVDGWMWLVPIAMLVPVVALAPATLLRRDPPLVFAFVLCALSAGLTLWLFASTVYVFTGRTLTVRSGPFRWTIDLAAVRSVVPTRSPLSSPALSLDRLEIRYGNKSLMVSPREREAFLRTLRERARLE